MKNLILIGIVVTAVVSTAQAATIYLKDGSRLQGTIVSATARQVRVHTADGLISLNTERIERIDYSESEPAVARTPEPPAEVVVRGPTMTDPIKRRSHFSLGLGFVGPISRVDFTSTGGGTDVNGNAGILLNGQYFYDLSPRLSLGGVVEFFNRAESDSQSLLPESNTTVYGNSVLYLAGLKYFLTEQGTVRPYLFGGLGANRTSTVIQSTPHPGFGWSDTGSGETRTLVNSSNSGLATSLRLGVDFLFVDPTVFSFELGWNRLSNPNYAATRDGQDVGLDSVTGIQNALILAFRCGWRF